MRQRMKPLQLGINYGMGVPSLARGLDRHPLIASEIIERHKRTYPRFWQWRENMVQAPCWIAASKASFGWPLHISTSPNKRTLYNFPMQSGGAEMLRLADVAPVRGRHRADHARARRHPARGDRREQIEHAKEIMRRPAATCAAASRSASTSTSGSTAARATATSGPWRRRCGPPSCAPAGCRSSLTEAGRGMTGVIAATVDASRWRQSRPASPRDGACGDTSSRCRCRGEELLEGASGPAYRLALYLAYLNWRGKGAPVTLSNSAVRGVGLERRAKWRALRELERRGLLSVERHPRRSPIVRLTSYVGRT